MRTSNEYNRVRRPTLSSATAAAAALAAAADADVDTDADADADADLALSPDPALDLDPDPDPDLDPGPGPDTRPRLRSSPAPRPRQVLEGYASGAEKRWIGYLGDQTLYTHLASRPGPGGLVYTLPCEWNRQVYLLYLLD